MQLEHFKRQLDKTKKIRPNFNYTFGEIPSMDNFHTVENRLSISIPEPIKRFYLIANGLETVNPNFKLIDINLWKVKSKSLHFASFDTSVQVHFDISNLNEAGEWTILTNTTNYEITKTVSSFWSNKIWHWIHHGRPIWADQWWVK